MKVVIADGHPTMRLGLKGLLLSTEMRVVGETGDGGEALRLARERQPDLVVLGLNLTGETDGIEACRRIKALTRPPRVLVYAAHDFADPVSSCLLAGVDCWLNKRVARVEFVHIMRRLVAGEYLWLSGAERTGTRALCGVSYETTQRSTLLTSK